MTMSKSQRPNPGRVEAIYKRFSAVGITHILDQTGEFTRWNLDLPDGIDEGVLIWLKQKGALHVVERKDNPKNGGYYCVYEWDEDVKERLEHYKDAHQTFADHVEGGCHCRVHIYNDPEGEFACRYCGHEYSRSEIKECPV